MIQDCFDRLFGSTSIAPWAEDNQGLISIIALVLALILFLVEQHRANDAEKRERRQAIEDAATAKAEASAAEIRAIEAAEAGRQEEREAARAAAIQAKLDHLHEFATAVRGVILDVENALLADQTYAKRMTHSQDFGLAAPTRETKILANAAADTLKAMLTSAPISPGLIRATCAAIKKLGEIDASEKRVRHADVDAAYAVWRDSLLGARSAVTDAVLERQNQIKPIATEIIAEPPHASQQF